MNQSLTTQEQRQVEFAAGIDTGLTAYQPANLQAAMELSQMLCKSGLVPKALQNRPADVLVLVATGDDYGLSWSQSLQNLYVVHGRIGSYAEFQRAKILQHPSCKKFNIIEATPERATIRVQSTSMDEPMDVTFTIDDAVRAGLVNRKADGTLTGGDNWTKYTEDMLVARATSRAKTRYFPHVFTNLPTVEELRDLPEPPTPSLDDSVAAERAKAIADAVVSRKGEEKAAPAPEQETKEEATEEEELEQSETEEEGAPRMADAFRKRIIKEVAGFGAKTVDNLVEAGITSAQHIVSTGESSLRSIHGIGKAGARDLFDWAQEVMEEESRPTIMDLAQEYGATKDQVRKQADRLLSEHWSPSAVGRSLDDLPKFLDEMLREWIKSGKQTSLLDDEEEQEEGNGKAEEVEAAAEEETTNNDERRISEERAKVLKGTLLRQMSSLPSEKAKDQHIEALQEFLEKQWGTHVFTELPESANGQILSWLSENDPS